MNKYHPPLEANVFYHVYNIANTNGENIFVYEGNYEYFLKKYAEQLSDFVETYAFCLLPNHFHFLVQVKSEDAIRNVVTNQEKYQKIAENSVSSILSEVFRRFFLVCKSFEQATKS